MALRRPPALEILGGIHVSGHRAAGDFACKSELQMIAGAVLRNIAVDANGISVDGSAQVAAYEIALMHSCEAVALLPDGKRVLCASGDEVDVHIPDAA